MWSSLSLGGQKPSPRTGLGACLAQLHAQESCRWRQSLEPSESNREVGAAGRGRVGADYITLSRSLHLLSNPKYVTVLTRNDNYNPTTGQSRAGAQGRALSGIREALDSIPASPRPNNLTPPGTVTKHLCISSHSPRAPSVTPGSQSLWGRELPGPCAT